MNGRLRRLAEELWLPSLCRLCARPTRGAALAVRGPQMDKPPALPAAFASLAEQLCPACLAAYARPGALRQRPRGLSPAMPPLLGWIGPYGAAERRLIHILKYHGRADIALLLGELLALALAAPWQPPHVLVPVPLHRDRLRTRGYNQAALIACAAASRLGWPWRDALSRVRSTRTQAGLDRAGREANVAGAFAVKGARSAGAVGSGGVVGERVLVVDDVCTTGATIAAAAAACRAAGAGRVAAAVLFVAPAGDLG